MKKDLKKLKEQFMECVECIEHHMMIDDMAGSMAGFEDARHIYETMIKQGDEGTDAWIEIVESEHHPAAILGCTLAYDLHPAKCMRELMRISRTGNAVSRHLADSTMNALRLGIKFDSPSRAKR